MFLFVASWLFSMLFSSWLLTCGPRLGVHHGNGGTVLVSFPCQGRWVHWSGFGLCSRIGSNMGSNMGSNIVPYIVPNMDFLGFSSIFIGGNDSGTVPWTCFSAFGKSSGTVPETVPWTCFSAFDPLHKDRSKKQKDHSSKTKQKQFLQNLQVSAKGWGDYTCSLSTAQREQLNVRERVKLDVEFAKIKDTFLHTSKSRSLDFCSVPSQFCRKDSDRERKYICTMRVR